MVACLCGGGSCRHAVAGLTVVVWYTAVLFAQSHRNSSWSHLGFATTSLHSLQGRIRALTGNACKMLVACASELKGTVWSLDLPRPGARSEIIVRSVRLVKSHVIGLGRANIVGCRARQRVR